MTQLTSNKYKKLLTVIPLACVLSTSMLAATTFTPTTTHAAASTIQESTIQGYLFKNGVKTPVYKNNIVKNRASSAYPVLSSDINDPIPDKGATTTITGVPGNIVYFEKMAFEKAFAFGSINEYGGAVANICVEKLSNGNIKISKYDPKTLQTSNIFDGNGTPTLTSQDTGPSKELYDRYNSIFTGNTVKREITYNKLGSALVPKTGSYTFSQAVTTGLSTSETIGAALSVGYKVSVKAGGGIIPAEATHELSTNLTTSFNQSTTVSEQTTRTQTLNSGTPSESYPNDKFWGATYQLKSVYTVQPGSNLQAFMQTHKAELAQKSFSYSEDDFYLAVTPGVAK